MEARMISIENWEVKVSQMSITELEEEIEIFTEAMSQSNNQNYDYNCWLSMRNDCRKEIDNRKRSGEGEYVQLSLFETD